MYHIICVISYEPYDLTHIIWADIVYKIWVFYDCILRPLGPRIDEKSSKSRKGYLCSMDECDFEGYKIFYHYLPRLKLQFNRDFKQYVTEAVKPINNNELGKSFAHANSQRFNPRIKFQ